MSAKPYKNHHCRVCHTMEPQDFYGKEKTLCRHCRSVLNRDRYGSKLRLKTAAYYEDLEKGFTYIANQW